MTLNYRMVERYPNLKEEVGGLNPNCEISSLPNGNLPGGQLPHVLLALACRPQAHSVKWP
jgi:hypothetical protein